MEWNYYLLGIFILIAFYVDVKYQKIPNWLTVSGVIAGLIYYLIANSFNGILTSIVGLFIGGGIMLILYLFRGVGAGDVKLFAAIGAITGYEFTLYSLMYSIVFAGIIGIFLLIMRKSLFQRMFYGFMSFIKAIRERDFKQLDGYKKKAAIRFPFMYAVLPGVALTLYYFINW